MIEILHAIKKTSKVLFAFWYLRYKKSILLKHFQFLTQIKSVLLMIMMKSILFEYKAKDNIAASKHFISKRFALHLKHQQLQLNAICSAMFKQITMLIGSI